MKKKTLITLDALCVVLWMLTSIVNIMAEQSLLIVGSNIFCAVIWLMALLLEIKNQNRDRELK